MKAQWSQELWHSEDRGYSTPCWIWDSHVVAKGYGRFYGKRIGTSTAAHRESWVRAGRTIPAGFQIDHLCRQPSCVNPDHLEPVPRRDNVMRGDGAHLVAMDIRDLSDLGIPEDVIANRFEVTVATVRIIIRRSLHP